MGVAVSFGVGIGTQADMCCVGRRGCVVPGVRDTRGMDVVALWSRS
jgi:hypothetical protein